MASGYLAAGVAAAVAVAVITRSFLICHRKTEWRPQMAYSFSSTPSVTFKRGKPVTDDVMEALADPNTYLIRVYGSEDEINDTVLQTVRRRVQREKLFDMVLTATVTKKPDVNKIQGEIARQLGLNFIGKSKDKSASELRDRIYNIHKLLIILRDLHREFDLGKVGIPFGADHMSCKILLTSGSKKVLSTQMHTQKNFMV